MACISGVSYLLPADAERLLEAVRQKHEERQQQVQSSAPRRAPVIDEKHWQFIASIVSVSLRYLSSFNSSNSDNDNSIVL